MYYASCTHPYTWVRASSDALLGSRLHSIARRIQMICVRNYNPIQTCCLHTSTYALTTGHAHGLGTKKASQESGVGCSEAGQRLAHTDLTMYIHIRHVCTYLSLSMHTHAAYSHEGFKDPQIRFEDPIRLLHTFFFPFVTC